MALLAMVSEFGDPKYTEFFKPRISPFRWKRPKPPEYFEYFELENDGLSQSTYMISRPGSSVEDLGIHRNTQTTSPLRRPEEVVLAVSDGSLDASERTAE